MLVHDLGPDVVAGFDRPDLATVTEEPASPIGTFDFHGCTVGIASFVGRGPWERHDDGDELLHILSGEMQLTVHEPDGERTVELRAGHVVVIPRGCWHGSDAPSGVTFLFFTPAVGNEYSMSHPLD